MVATHIIPLSPWQDAAFSVRRGLVRRGMLLTKVRTLPGQTAAHAWQTALFSSVTVERGCSCLRSKLTFDPKHAQLGSCLDSELASPWPQHPAGPKRLPRHVLYGVRHCLGSKHSHVQTPPLAMATVDSSGSGCTDAGWRVPSNTTSSLLSTWWIAPHTMIDGPQFPSLGWTQALISLFPCLRRTWTRRSLWYRENQDSSLKIQCLHCLRSHTLCLLPHSRRRRLCSKVSLGHLAGCRDQYPAARSRLRMDRTRTFPSPPPPPPPKKKKKPADHLHLQTRSRDEAVRSDHSEQLTVFPWRGYFHRTSTLPLMWWANLSVASQNFAYASLRHLQHPGYLSLRIAICWQPDNLLQYLLWQILWHDPL